MELGRKRVLLVLTVSPNRVAACSTCLQMFLVCSCVCATISASFANSNSRIHSSRVFILAFCLANLNNIASDLVRMETSEQMCWDTVSSNATGKRINKVGAKTHPCFSPWLISNGSVPDPPIDTAPGVYHNTIP